MQCVQSSACIRGARKEWEYSRVRRNAAECVVLPSARIVHTTPSSASETASLLAHGGGREAAPAHATTESLGGTPAPTMVYLGEDTASPGGGQAVGPRGVLAVSASLGSLVLRPTLAAPPLALPGAGGS